MGNRRTIYWGKEIAENVGRRSSFQARHESIVDGWTFQARWCTRWKQNVVRFPKQQGYIFYGIEKGPKSSELAIY